jgi:hypothetical protein
MLTDVARLGMPRSVQPTRRKDCGLTVALGLVSLASLSKGFARYVAIALQAIEGVAPDQASLSAARKIKPNSWPLLGKDEGRGLIWGECQGSGSSPYRIGIDLADLGAKCTCPSRKFPCKHSLALMLAAAEHFDAFVPGTAPDWVNDWLSRRRPGAGSKASGKPEEKASLAAVEDVAQSDPEAEARAAARREKLRQQREESILGGLDELDKWIGDQIEVGLASFAARASQQCRLVAQRLVDAKAPGLATQLDALPSSVLILPEAERAQFAMEMLGSFHLLAEAYRRQDRLPEALRHDVRRLVGWTTERQELLDDPSALRMKGTWLVLATRSEIQPDKLRRIETWLMSTQSRFAVLIDFVPVVAGQGGSALVPGEAFEAELVYYPSAAPLRALVAQRGAEQTFEWPSVQNDLGTALATYDSLTASFPWIGAAPLLVSDVKIVGPDDGRIWLVAETGAAPVARKQKDEVLALTAADVSSIMGLWDGRAFTALTARTSLGVWHHAP